LTPGTFAAGLELLNKGIPVGLREPIDSKGEFIAEVVKIPCPPGGESQDDWTTETSVRDEEWSTFF
jgi:hypothetical protein